MFVICGVVALIKLVTCDASKPMKNNENEIPRMGPTGPVNEKRNFHLIHALKIDPIFEESFVALSNIYPSIKTNINSH